MTAIMRSLVRRRRHVMGKINTPSRPPMGKLSLFLSQGSGYKIRAQRDQSSRGNISVTEQRLLGDFNPYFESPIAASAVQTSPSTQCLQFPTLTMDAGSRGTWGLRSHPGTALVILSQSNDAKYCSHKQHRPRRPTLLLRHRLVSHRLGRAVSFVAVVIFTDGLWVTG